MACGIYAILNLETNMIYIGSSVNIKRRGRKHKGALNKGKHGNKRLQLDWLTYGSNAFVFKTLEEVIDDRELQELEEFYIASVDPTYLYNISCPTSPEIAIRDRYNNGHRRAKRA